MMLELEELLTSNRALLLERWQEKVSQRTSGGRKRDAKASLAAFLGELAKPLRVDRASQPADESAAGRHGKAMLEQGFSVEDVVLDYSDLRQGIVELAIENDAAISLADLLRLARRVDRAAAAAVVQYVSGRDATAAAERDEEINYRLGVFAHGLRNLLTTATLAVHISRSGSAGLAGASGQILDRSLKGLSQLIDRSLAAARLGRENVVEPEVFSLAEFIAEIQAAAALDGQTSGCSLIVAPVDPRLSLRGDRDLLMAAVSGLLQNAFKFTRKSTQVRLKAYAKAGRIRIDVEDDCGGLPTGGMERLFLPYGQRRGDQVGVGLGLSIARQSVEANGGELTVRDIPGTGCVFTIDLPAPVESDDA